MADAKNPEKTSDLQQILTKLSEFDSKFTELKTNTENLVKTVENRVTDLEKDLVGSNVDEQDSLSHQDVVTQPNNTQTSLFDKFMYRNSSPVPRKRSSSVLDDGSTKGGETSSHLAAPVKKKRKKSKKSKDTSSSSSDSETDSVVDIQMEQLMDEYKSTKPKYLEDPTTVGIQEPLAHLLETWFWTVYSKEEVKNELAKTLRPSNATALIPTRINEAIFRSLSAQALSKDMPARFIQNAFMKASQPFSVVWSTLIALENFLKSQDLPMETTFSPQLAIDFQHLRKQMDLGMRLLGIANSQMVVHRKEVLSNYLNKDFKKICKSHVAFDQWMFGSNLKGLLEDTVRVNKLVMQNKPTQSSVQSSSRPFFRGRGGQLGPRGNYKRSQRYQSQRGRGLGRGYQVQSSTQGQQQQSAVSIQSKSQIKR